MKERKPTAVIHNATKRDTMNATICPTCRDKPVLIDFYCCEGGASKGYDLAGFDVVGVDIDEQPRYPFPFLRMDALESLRRLIAGETLEFAVRDGSVRRVDRTMVRAAAASPPCQRYTNAQKIMGNDHPDLLEPTRHLLRRLGVPYVIENVPGAPMLDPIELCGSMFGLRTYRHRLFESEVQLVAPAHPEHVARTTKMGRKPVDGENMHIVGNFSGVSLAREIMGMDWASRDGLREAIPPAYTEYIGRALLAHLNEGEAPL